MVNATGQTTGPYAPSAAESFWFISIITFTIPHTASLGSHLPERTLEGSTCRVPPFRGKLAGRLKINRKNRTSNTYAVYAGLVGNIRPRNLSRTHLVGASRHSCYQGNVTDPAFISIKLYIQTLHMQNIASQRFMSRHETTVASFDMGSSRPRFEGRPTKGSRPPRAKQSQGEITKTSPSGPARPCSEVDRDISTFSCSILTPSQTHRISTEERPAGHRSLSNGSGICREAG